MRWMIKRVIADCIMCRLMEKKTLELRLENHPEARTVLAPVLSFMHDGYLLWI